VSYWRLGEPSGTTAADSKGTNTGTYTGGYTLGQTGAIANDSNTAVLLNGTTGFVAAPNVSTLDLANGPWTYEAWAKTPVSTFAILFGKGSGSVGIFGSGSVIGLRKFGTGVIVQSSAAVPWHDGNWHYIVASKNGATSHLYFDGIDVTGVISDLTGIATASKFGIGSVSGDSWNTGWQGSIDEAAVYNVVLSAATVSAHYAAGTGAP
jgi:large repetitive protein